MKKELYIVDGYNMIGAWPELVALKKADDIESARDLLLHECSNFQKFENIEVWVVFDAQFVPGVQQSFDKYAVKVIFTAEKETADSYIERTVPKYNNRLTQVSVATSDLAEQWMIFQQGALRKSAREFYNEIKESKKKQRDISEQFELSGKRRKSPWDDKQWQELDQLRFALHYSKED
ncbi:hypothetical protein SAMN05421767_1575 [Granulicatella balaenopterae]|uniref:YacP-like NYN domain-containing protein n=1 Tax=Granulicatella balaenopterae TaxID=137733 RepID=A0A1H9PEU0_9LACT|nr:NYN domain-containing protein [Granulicatella balaenopterae]SER46776.1 hypothetical protein SAMN05421767_1575 [Granulicatella balaenopterae]